MSIAGRLVILGIFMLLAHIAPGMAKEPVCKTEDKCGPNFCQKVKTCCTGKDCQTKKVGNPFPAGGKGQQGDQGADKVKQSDQGAGKGKRGDQGAGKGKQGNQGAGKGKQGDQGASKKSTTGERSCPPGYVVLEKANKYGAFCEPREGFCPSDRPNGTPPKCCANGTVWRDNVPAPFRPGCFPPACGPGQVGVPPQCDRTCAPGKIKVDQTCYDPCPGGSVGTPPNCTCPAGQFWDAANTRCKERPKCAAGMVGTPPNCTCPSGTVLANGKCQACTGGKVASKGVCKCPSGMAEAGGTCNRCKGGRVAINNRCVCPAGTIEFRTNGGQDYTCYNGTQIVCRWRGTAPFCDGSCLGGEVYRGAGRSASDTMPGTDAGGFGSKCLSGSKFYCCRPE